MACFYTFLIVPPWATIRWSNALGINIQSSMSALMFYFQSKLFWINAIGPIQDRREVEGKKALPTNFSLVTSPNTENILQTFGLLVLVLFPHCCKVSRSPSTSPKLFNLNQKHSSKILFFHRNARVTKVWSHENIYIIIWLTWNFC